MFIRELERGVFRSKTHFSIFETLNSKEELFIEEFKKVLKVIFTHSYLDFRGVLNFKFQFRNLCR